VVFSKKLPINAAVLLIYIPAFRSFIRWLLGLKLCSFALIIILNAS